MEEKNDNQCKEAILKSLPCCAFHLTFCHSQMEKTREIDGFFRCYKFSNCVKVGTNLASAPILTSVFPALEKLLDNALAFLHQRKCS
jgi:hypothetical protein